MVERGLCYVPQGRRVFKHLTVLENLEVGGHMIKSKKIREERIADVLETFPALKAKLKSKSSELSGGQQQMLAIARGLMIDPKVLLLDEPTLGLSPKLVKEVFAHIDAIRRNRKIGIIVVEHNLKSLLEFADRAFLLERGKVVAHGSAKSIAEGEEFKRLLLGSR
jgi:branched-chain amino acid transport system ATP-binding protein